MAVGEKVRRFEILDLTQSILRGVEHFPRKALNWSSGTQAPGTFQSANTNRAVQNHHPTVKPTDLMRYLCRLVTPKGGVVLDPFAGSGTTGEAARREGFDCILLEAEAEYVDFLHKRFPSERNWAALAAGLLS